MDREKLRRFADGLPLMVALLGLGRYLLAKPLGMRGGSLAGVAAVFVLALVVSWVLRRISGMTWREALWPPREAQSWEKQPPSMGLVKELAQNGQRIQAIKMYRELTGADLKTSAEAVKAMQP